MLVFWLALEATFVLLGPIVLGYWLQRQWGARWRTWLLGAVAFLASQLFRIPLLLGLTLLFQTLALPLSDAQNILVNLVILAVTAGLFEETARYVVLRYWATDARRWRDGLMFGAGHGGIEAMLLVGGSVVGAFMLLAAGPQMIAQLEEQNPQQAAVLAQQLENLRQLAWWTPLLAVWERVVAITFHMAATLWVLRAVTEQRIFWWLAAVVLHAIFNAAAVAALQWGGVLAAEVTVTLACPLFLSIIWHNRPHPPAPAEFPQPET